MTITAKVIEDSISPDGIRLTTLELYYPRFIHAELMTHRVLSRNASSSRATPVKVFTEQIRNNPAFFVSVGMNKPGMQAREEAPQELKDKFEQEWRELGNIVAGFCERWGTEYKLHKQVANRALEPWQHIKVLVTATDWDNFFTLRDHPDAQPEIHELAIQMKLAMGGSIIRGLTYKDWHLPYVSEEEKIHWGGAPWLLQKISAARCARVSYLNHDASGPTIAKDLNTFEVLAGGNPIHASPLEHQATPLDIFTSKLEVKVFAEGNAMVREAHYKLSETRNLFAWKPFRSFFEEGEVQ